MNYIIIYLNAESVIKNHEKIELLIADKNPLMVMCTETRTTTEIEDSEIKCKNYKAFRCDSVSRHTGGVIIYVHKNVKAKIISKKVYDKNLWVMTIQLIDTAINGLFTVLYHSPSTSDSSFIEYFENYLESVINYNKTNLIVGDFNINWNKTTSISENLKQIIDQASLVQIMTENTRTTKTASTLIDLVITNKTDITCNILKDHKVSDHETIEIRIPKSVRFPIAVKKEINDWSNYTKDNMIASLVTLEWTDFGSLQIDRKLQMLCENIEKAVRQIVQRKSININSCNKWFDNEIYEMKREKTQIYEAAKQTKSEADWTKYSEIRNKYNNLIKSKKSSYTKSQIIKSGNNQRQMWKNLKILVDNKTKQTSDIIYFDNDPCSDNKKIAQKFNNYFVNSIIEINHSIPALIDEYEKHGCLPYEEFKFKMVDVDTINKLIKKMKNKANKNEIINTQVIKDSLEVTAYFFSEIINESYKTSKIPDQWKISTISPIPKINDTSKATEYRQYNKYPTSPRKAD